MKITGKCKEDFEKWYADTYYHKQRKTIQNLQRLVFDSLPDNQKYGVYVDFFDSVNLIIEIKHANKNEDIGLYKWWIRLNGVDPFYYSWETRHEARVKAIEKANEIYNKK